MREILDFLPLRGTYRWMDEQMIEWTDGWTGALMYSCI